ncbi:MAG: hypothetical protein ACYDA6_01470 [Solirubrobacteraceae bacterium]
MGAAWTAARQPATACWMYALLTPLGVPPVGLVEAGALEVVAVAASVAGALAVVLAAAAAAVALWLVVVGEELLPHAATPTAAKSAAKRLKEDLAFTIPPIVGSNGPGPALQLAAAV